MINEITKKITEAIKNADTVIISRHLRPDGDAIGSTKGFATILRDSFPGKNIYLVNSDYSDGLSFLGDEKCEISDDVYNNAVVIVIDTATTDRISNPKYSLGKSLIKIDHHVDIKPYGDISWVEDYRSSASEMIADLCFSDETYKISSSAATCLYAGMLTDTGRFKFSPTGDTLRTGAKLLDKGIDTETLHANLYLESFDYLKFRAFVFGKMKSTENGVSYLYVDSKMQEKWHLSREEASGVVSLLDSIKGSLIWIAFIDNQDGTIRVRLRSRFLAINKLAENYRGGGHEKAAGATLYKKSEMQKLLKEADALLLDYKNNNEGWQ